LRFRASATNLSRSRFLVVKHNVN